MTARPKLSGPSAGRGGRTRQQPGSDHDRLAAELNQAVSRAARRLRRRRAARELTEKIPDAAVEILLEFVQNLLP
jgi:hypothetical protein